MLSWTFSRDSSAVWGRWSGKPGVGIPLGSATSALVANLYLEAFDHFIKDELGGKFYVRYSDDMAFLSADRGELEGLLQAAPREHS